MIIALSILTFIFVVCIVIWALIRIRGRSCSLCHGNGRLLPAGSFTPIECPRCDGMGILY